jgi:membrane-associated phospholipid phosphatase
MFYTVISDSVYWVVAMFVICSVYQGNYQSVASMALMLAFVLILKRCVGKERPDKSDKQSFPSGHSALSMHVTLAMFISHGIVALLPGIAWTVSVAVSRVKLHRHFVSDTIVGVLLAALFV